MKETKKEITVFESFDGTVFQTESECLKYEDSKLNDINLKHFKFEIPFGDYCSDWSAYYCKSENEFNMLKAKFDNYAEINDSDLEYDGNGWYAVEETESGYVMSYKLSSIMSEFTSFIDTISEKIMNEMEV